MTQFRSRPEEPKKEEPRFPKREEPKAEAKKPEAKEEPKKEESGSTGTIAGVRRNRVTVLRDLVEDLESESNISEEQRQDFMQLNRRLTRALAR